MGSRCFPVFVHSLYNYPWYQAILPAEYVYLCSQGRLLLHYGAELAASPSESSLVVRGSVSHNDTSEDCCRINPKRVCF